MWLDWPRVHEGNGGGAWEASLDIFIDEFAHLGKPASLSE